MASNHGEVSDSHQIVQMAGRLSKTTLSTPGVSCSNRVVGRDPKRSGRLFRHATVTNHEDGLQFSPLDYSETERQQRLQEFLDTSAPSKVKRSDGIGWIVVRSPSFQDECLGDVDGLVVAWEVLTNSRATVNFDAVTELAKTYGCLPGIWLLFFDTGAPIDDAWEKIARATVRGELGTHAKVTPREDEGKGKKLHGTQHAISVYTEDFTDKDDVLRLEGRLRAMGMRGRMSYKPRVYSCMGVYSQNKWRLRPGIYTSMWDVDKKTGSIRDCTKTPDKFMINYQ